MLTVKVQTRLTYIRTVLPGVSMIGIIICNSYPTETVEKKKRIDQIHAD